MTNPTSNEFEHAWKYFEIHANQRMQMFNYYIAISTAIIAGLATSFQIGIKLSVLGIILGVMLILVSIIFWKLDERTSFLIKHVENAMTLIERDFKGTEFYIFLNEAEKTNKDNNSKCKLTGMWTYSRSFHFMFFVMSMLGAIGSVISLLINIKYLSL